MMAMPQQRAANGYFLVPSVQTSADGTQTLYFRFG
jgi:hypothetical protein